MSFVDEYALSRSSVFKVLLGLLFSIALFYSLFAHLVYISSENFHRQLLYKHLQDEILEFGDASLRGSMAVEQLLGRKREETNSFIYNLSLSPLQPNSLHSYPIVGNGAAESTLVLPDGRQLEIGINPDLLEAYRDTIGPMMLTGVALPVILMFAGAATFALVILQKLQRVNQAMNRVMCGEKRVKLPVSRNDDEFDILAIHLNYMIEQIEKNETTLKSLTVGIAHDMRTPMARLKLRLEQMLENPADGYYHKKNLVACHEELELLLSLFNSMLEIAKLNSGQLPIDSQVVNLATVAQDVTEFLLPLAEQKEQTLILREDQLCEIKGDRSLLFRATFNLVENAVKYTPEKGEIEVVIDKLGVVVADSGVGISDKDKAHVCEPMYRADKSRTKHGSGLGLALVEAVMRRHQARLIFRDNKPGLRARLFFG